MAKSDNLPVFQATVYGCIVTVRLESPIDLPDELNMIVRLALTQALIEHGMAVHLG